MGRQSYYTGTYFFALWTLLPSQM